jgi:ferric-dicitrate binding protein FerR (iron transport regulator)
VTSASVLIRKAKRTIVPCLAVCFIHLLALQLILFTALATARPASGAQEKEPLGSLSSVGQVYVSNAVVPGESTIFTGDTLRTDDTATATFTISGKGSFEIASRSQLVFTGSQQYVAELKSGTVVMSSMSGASGINLRIGNFVVVGVTQAVQSTAKIDSAAGGSFLITCSEGSVGIVPLEGPPNGVFLQAGQSVTISPQGELSAPTTTVASNVPATATQAQPVKKSHTAWILLGVAAGGGVGAAVALAGHKSSTVSPSTVD